MRKLSIFVCVCLLAACVTLLCGCTQNELKIETPSNLSLAVGTSQKVSYTVNPVTAFVTFDSDNPDVVKKDGNMLIAVSVGSATITFRAQNKGKTATATCVVTVYDPNATPDAPEKGDDNTPDDETELVSFYLNGTNGKFDKETCTLTVKQGQLSFFRVNFDENIENFNQICENYTLSSKDFDVSLSLDGYAWNFTANQNGTINIMFENAIIGIINIVVE